MERRYVSRVELRADGQGDEMSIMGYAAKWNSLSERLGNGSFRETIKRGAFARSLQSDRSDVSCLVNHDPSLLLGRQKNGTLRVSEDSVGLRFRCVLPQTQVARDLHALVKRGDISGCSFAFQIDGPDGESWDSEVDDPDTGERIALRTILRANLFDVSAVTSPAYPSTSVSASTLPELNHLHRSPTDYWPMGLPSSFGAELRSRIMSAEPRNRRRNLLDFVLN